MAYNSTRERPNQRAEDSIRPFRELVTITPTDGELARYVRGLRVYNTNAAVKAISIVPTGQESDTGIILKVPPGLSDIIGEIRRVNSTGTDTSDLEIHGYLP